MSNDLPVSEVRRLLDYDPETGTFTWRSRPRSDFQRDQDWARWNNKHAGRPAFTVKEGGYLTGRLVGRMRKAHRVAWAYVHGDWPRYEIDHVNRDKADNRISNLRDVSRSANLQNMPKPKNNTSGVVGVYLRKDSGMWRAVISVSGTLINLGHFISREDATAARKAAERKYEFHPGHGL